MSSEINLLPQNEQEEKKKKSKPVVIEMTTPDKFEQPRKKAEGGVLYFFRKVFKRPKPAKEEQPPRRVESISKTYVDKGSAVELPKIRFVKEPDRPHEVPEGPKPVTHEQVLSEMREGTPGVGVPPPQRFTPSSPPERRFEEQRSRVISHLPPPPQKQTQKSQGVKEVRFVASDLPKQRRGPSLLERFSAWVRKLFRPRTPSKPPQKVPEAPLSAPVQPVPEKVLPQVEKTFIRTVPAVPPAPTVPPPPSTPHPKVPSPIQHAVPPVPQPPKKVSPSSPIPPPRPKPRGPSLWSRITGWFSHLFSRREVNVSSASQPPPEVKPQVKRVPPSPPAPAAPPPALTKPGSPPPQVAADQGAQYTAAPQIQRGRMSGVNLVPEEILQRGQPAPYLRMIGLVVLAEILVLVIGYLGINFWQKSIIGETQEIDKKIEQVQQRIATFDTFRKDSESLKRHIEDVTYVLDHRVHWTDFLTLLERHTLPSVTYSSLAADTTGHVTLNASTASILDVSRQLTLLQHSSDFAEEVSVTSVAPVSDDLGAVSYSFVISFLVPQKMFYSSK